MKLLVRTLRLVPYCNDRLVDKFPLAVLFRLVLVAVVVIPTTLLGVVIASSATAEEPTVPASSLMPDQGTQEIYQRALERIQRECGRTQPLSGSCFTNGPSTSRDAVSDLDALIASLKLSNCTILAMPASDAAEYDYYGCRGDASAGAALVGTWVLLAILGGVVGIAAYGGVLRDRHLVPRFNPRLWMTPYAVCVPLLCALPLMASVWIFFERIDTERSGISPVNVDTAAGLATAILFMATVLVADLRTSGAERAYLVVVFTLAAVVGLLSITVLAVDGLGSQWLSVAPRLMVDAVPLLAATLALAKVARHPIARTPVWALSRFARRLSILLAPSALALTLLILHWATGWSIAGVSLLTLGLVALVVGLLVSLPLEGAVH